jgi:PIN domain nuclease of toxin-antitoxin system
VNYLLDTSVLLWAVAARHKLNARCVELLSSKSASLYLSSATAWELGIKHALGKLQMHIEPAEFVPEVIRGLDLTALDITCAHGVEAGRLPGHHRDPFDRMLIAQARLEGLTLLTGDRVFGKYQVEQMFCGR